MASKETLLFLVKMYAVTTCLDMGRTPASSHVTTCLTEDVNTCLHQHATTCLPPRQPLAFPSSKEVQSAHGIPRTG